jgi:hypothetical protein
MRGIGAAVLALLVGVACGTADATPSSTQDESTPRATLRITSLDPLTVAGTRFAPGERVKLLVGTRMKATRADERGRFRTSFRIEVGRCSGVVVQAFGARGSRAMADVTAPQCAPSPSATDSEPPYTTPGERP